MKKMQKNLQKAIDGTLIIETSSLEPLRFFPKKYLGKKQKNSLRIKRSVREDLVKFCFLFFENAAVIYFLDVQKEFCNEFGMIKWCIEGIPRQSTYRSMKTVEELRCFYDLNKDRSHGIKDQRYELFFPLKHKIMNLMVYLEKRTKPLPVYEKRARSKRTYKPVPIRYNEAKNTKV